MTRKCCMIRSLRRDLVRFYLWNMRFTVCFFYACQREFLAECLYVVFRYQRVILFLVFFLFWLLFDTKKYFLTDMKSFHMRSKSFKKQVTIWLQFLNVLDSNHIIVRDLLPHEMYVFNLFFLTSVFFWGGVGYLALLNGFVFLTSFFSGSSIIRSSSS